MTTQLVNIRTFEADDWLLYKETRLRALKDSPDAFASTYETASAIPDKQWQARIAQLDRDNNLPLAAYVDNVIAGMAWVKIEDAEATLLQMWVSPEFRGFGVGSAILNAGLQWAEDKNAATMHLGVTMGDSPATRMYESAGFVSTGVPEPLREGSELQIQNMRRQLNRV